MKIPLGIKQLFVAEAAKDSLEAVISITERSDAVGKDCRVKIELKSSDGSYVLEDEWKRYDRDDEDFRNIRGCEVTGFTDTYGKGLAVEGLKLTNPNKEKKPLPADLTYRQAVKVFALLGYKNPASTAEQWAYRETSNPNINPEKHMYNTESFAKLTAKFVGKQFAYAAIRAVI